MAQYSIDISQIPDASTNPALIAARNAGITNVIISAATQRDALSALTRSLGVSSLSLPSSTGGVYPSSLIHVATADDIRNAQSVDLTTFQRTLEQVSQTQNASGSQLSIEQQLAGTGQFGERTGSGITGSGITGTTNTTDPLALSDMSPSGIATSGGRDIGDVQSFTFSVPQLGGNVTVEAATEGLARLQVDQILRQNAGLVGVTEEGAQISLLRTAPGGGFGPRFQAGGTGTFRLLGPQGQIIPTSQPSGQSSGAFERTNDIVSGLVNTPTPFTLGQSASGTPFSDAISGGTPQEDLLDREGVFPEAAFRSFLRSGGINPGGIGGRVLSNQFGPALNTFAVLNDLGLLPENQSFTSFLGQGPLGRTRLSGALRGALNQAQLPEDFEVFGQGGTFTDAARALAAAVQQSRGGSPLTAGIFSPSIAQVESRAQDLGFAGGQAAQQNFLDFLRQQFRPQFAGA